MAPHFVWIKSHLLLLSQALENTIHDDIASIRQRTARCMDIIAHSIGNYLLEQSDAAAATTGTEFEEDVEVALLYWSKILPSVTEQLQNMGDDQSGATKSIFCDVFSNIGVHVFERMSVSVDGIYFFGRLWCGIIGIIFLYLDFPARQTNIDYFAVVGIIVGR